MVEDIYTCIGSSRNDTFETELYIRLKLSAHNIGHFLKYRTRKENMSRAMEHELNGNLTAAYECYQKAVDISPSVAYELIQVIAVPLI